MSASEHAAPRCRTRKNLVDERNDAPAYPFPAMPIVLTVRRKDRFLARDAQHLNQEKDAQHDQVAPRKVDQQEADVSDQIPEIDRVQPSLRLGEAPVGPVAPATA